MPSVVVDSACLIALERIDQLSLLPRLFPSPVAPPAVVAEFGRPIEWLDVRTVVNQVSTAALRTQLHRGEAEAIAVRAQHSARLPLLPRHCSGSTAARVQRCVQERILQNVRVAAG